MSDPTKITMVDSEGRAFDVDPSQVDDLRSQGLRVEGGQERTARVVEEARRQHFSDGVWNKVAATMLGGARTISAGGSDAVLAALGAGEDVAAAREYNPGASLAGELTGVVLPTGIPGLAARAGRAVGKVDDAAGAFSKIAGAAKGTAVEGAILGAGQGVSEIALSKDPLTLERAVSALGSNVLFGGAVGGAAGGALKAGGIGLRAAQSKLDDIARGAGQADDAAKVALRDELAAFRAEMKDAKPWLAAKDTGVDGLQTVGKRTLKADKAMDNLLDDPKALIDNPKAALRHLRVQEAALQEVASKTDEIRSALVAKGSKQRLAALDRVAPALEKNRALQAKIGEMTKPVEKAGALGGLASGVVGGQAFGLGASIAGAIPGIGAALAPIVGGVFSKLATGGLGKSSAQVAKRGSEAIEKFLGVSSKVPAGAAPVLASKVLSAVRYSDSAPKASKPAAKTKEAPKLADSYKARVQEIRSQTQRDLTGTIAMRPEARSKVYDRLAPVRQIFGDVAADRIETIAARRLEFLASKIPYKPDVHALAVGPDIWQPSDMEMRTFARYAAAVEDPTGVVERLADGTVTPEDAEAMREVYPEMYAQIQQQIMESLGTLREVLPYKRRVALSIFSDIPVDPAMDPQILRVLQAQYAAEAGTEGGTQAPTPQPQFGSVRADAATPAQQRQEA